ncbi:MAG TPA: isoprenylcysteine carboxylmethyltransferase family protein [Anaerolineales bacterium]|nr:isoprenylcysteine carboxylmethyltransferase family protein [Anaerolineales bacterium]
MNPTSMSRERLWAQVVIRMILFVPLMVAIVFWPAGTLAFWEGWVYLAVLYLPALYMMGWLLKHSPALLERRMNLRERTGGQPGIVIVSGVVMIAAFMLPGLDHRLQWSDVPTALVIAADLIVLASYGLVMWVMRTNQYASRVVEVSAAQTVINTGPYAVVRHPMYVGVIGMILATPLALGSFWALLPALGIVPALMARIVGEEAVLRRELAGYSAYVEQVRYRLIPGVW